MVRTKHGENVSPAVPGEGSGAPDDLVALSDLVSAEVLRA